MFYGDLFRCNVASGGDAHHQQTISFKKTIRTLFQFHLENLIGHIKRNHVLDYDAFLHQILKTGLIGFQKLMGHFGKAYVNIFYEIEISLNSNITHHPNVV